MPEHDVCARLCVCGTDVVVLLLDPGSGDACEALQGCFRVYLAVDPSYDIQAAALPRPPHSLSRRTSAPESGQRAASGL